MSSYRKNSILYNVYRWTPETRGFSNKVKWMMLDEDILTSAGKEHPTQMCTTCVLYSLRAM